MPALSGFFCVLALKVERDENDQRKEPTISEKVALAVAIGTVLDGRHGGDRKTDQGGNISTLKDAGKTRDIAAAKVGLGSGKTLEAAQQVIATGEPELWTTPTRKLTDPCKSCTHPCKSCTHLCKICTQNPY